MNMKMEYSGQLSGVEAESSDVECQEKGFRSAAVEAQTIVQLEDACLREICCCVTEI